MFTKVHGEKFLWSLVLGFQRLSLRMSQPSRAFMIRQPVFFSLLEVYMWDAFSGA